MCVCVYVRVVKNEDGHSPPPWEIQMDDAMCSVIHGEMTESLTSLGV